MFDDYKREGLAIEADFSLPSQRVIRVLEQLLEWRSPPLAIRCDNGPEFISNEFVQWAQSRDIRIDYIQPGKPQQAERAIRPFAIGRKNWLFSNSQAGAKASANLYSLVETAKANQLNPYEYLTHIFKQLPNAQNIDDIEVLLPWVVKLG